MAGETPSLDTIFCTAVEIASPEERAAYIAGACGGDQDLHGRVEKLVDAHFRAGRFLEAPAPAMLATAEEALTERPGTVIGPYKLLDQIGEGGFGVVFMAEQQHPVRRKVALKVIKPGMDTRQVIARFEAERQALALMEHSNIARVLDAGTTGFVVPPSSGTFEPEDRLKAELRTGRPYFVMELVRGLPMTEFCDQNNLSIHDRLELFVDVCQAVQHAHQKGIIHRDIKPSNVLVTMHDGKPVAKVIDFGIAKAMGQQLTEKTLFTNFAAMIGTPLYMSPEQAELSGLDVDTRSDIYSLGVLLYELLTGTTPFDKERLKTASFDEIRRIIREEEPPKPSVRMSQSSPHAPREDCVARSGTACVTRSVTATIETIATKRRSDPRKLSRLFRGELDWIVMKALDKDRNRRYETANAFAQDVRRYLRDEPVQACPPSAQYRFRKFTRRNKGLLLAAGLVVLALICGVVGTTAGLVQAKWAEASLRHEADQKEIARAGEERQRQLAMAEKNRAEQRLVRLYVANGVRLMDEGDLLGSLPWFAGALKLDEGDPGREEMQRVRLAAVLRSCPKIVQVLSFQPGPASAALFSPDGSRVLAVYSDGTARVWDVATGRPVSPPLAHKGSVNHAAFSPDGRCLITASGEMGQPGAARVWDVVTGKLVAPALQHNDRVEHVAFSSDARRVVTASGDGTARVWDAATGEPVAPPLRHDAPVHHASFSPDGRRVVTGSEDNTARVWNAATGQPVTPPLEHKRSVDHAAFSPDGCRVLTTGSGARVWDAATGQPVTPPLGSNGWVNHAAFSPDGRRVVTAHMDGTAQVWDAATGQPVAPALRHNRDVQHAEFSPDGDRVVTASKDGTARVWDAATGRPVTPPLRHHTAAEVASFSPDGRQVLTLSGATARVWDVSLAKPFALSLQHDKGVRCASFSPDGRRFLTASGNASRVWETVGGKPVSPPVTHNGEGDVLCASFSPDGRLVVTAAATARVWNAATGEAVTPPLTHKTYIYRASFSPDGRRIVTAGEDETARVWDAATGQALAQPLVHHGGVVDASFSPDGRLVVTASWDGTAQVWDAATGQALLPALRHNRELTHAEFSRDGGCILTSCRDGMARVWDAATGQPVAAPLTHKRLVAHAAFSPDAGRVVTASWDGTARVWDAATGQPVTPPLAHKGNVNHAAFSSDGRRVVTASDDWTARVWDAATGDPITLPLRHDQAVKQAAFSADGGRVVTASLDGTARVWELPPEDRPGDDLVRWAEVLAAHQIDATGGLVPLEGERLQTSWEAHRSRYP
jgi:WD40 repeat protein/serine/threonine protein kinase